MKKNSPVTKEIKTSFVERITEQPFRVYAILLLSVLVVFFQSLKFDFTNHDDLGLLASKELKLSNISTIFNKGVFYFTGEIKPEKDTYYRPLQNLVYALGKDIGGKKPAIFHFMNLLLHFISVCLLYYFLMVAGNKKTVALAAALLFAVHPMLVQAVVWIPGTGELLITIFLLTSFIYLIRYYQETTQKNSLIVFSSIAFLLALLSKESAIGFLPLSIFYILFINKNKENIFSKNIISFAGMALAVIIWYLLRQHAIGQYSQVTLSSIIFSLINHGSLILYYISKAFFPFFLSPLPSLADADFITVAVILIILTIGIFFIKDKKLSPMLLMGVLWYALFLIPTLFVAQTDFDFYMYNHRMYLPMIGIIILVIEIFDFNHRSYSEKIVYPSVLILFVIFMFSSISYAKAFKNTSVFYKTSVDHSPHSWLAYEGLGSWYMKNNDCDKAIENYQKLAEMKPTVHSFYGLVGNAYLNCKNDVPNAIQWYEKAMKVDAGNLLAANTAISLGNIYSMAVKDTGKAIFYYKKAISIDSNQSFPMSMLGNIYLTRASIDSASFWFNKTLKSDSSSSVAYYGLGSIAYSNKKYKDAVLSFEKALQYNPTEIQIVRFLMFSYREINNPNDTRKYASEYKRRGGVVPDYISIYLKENQLAI